MPGAQLNNKPVSAERFSDSSEESQLELHLQRQLEEDVARIYDESIYSDLEVVCGKLKILTHSCILKARTKKFYRQLHNILHVNIERDTFDEIYSFISDVYTECNIQHEEKEIISYLERNLNVKKCMSGKPNKEEETLDVFSTPKCITPKEFYALVPIEEKLLDKELIEQDKLSYAFHSIIKGQAVNTSKVNIPQRNKPTSLPLDSSHTSKAVKHSSICDISNKDCLKDNVSPTYKKKQNIVTDEDFKSNQTLPLNDITEINTNIDKNINNSNLGSEKLVDPIYSPDSLVTDEPSSSSDYLSAAYTFSPGASSSGCQLRVNFGNCNSKMENIYTLSDSGLEDTGMLGSVTSHNDVTLTNVSLSENTLHDIMADDVSISVASSIAEKQHFQRSKQSGTSSEIDFNGQHHIVTEMCGKSLKEEKQRQNEEIVILESSSLSSETGSWESVYPHKFVEREICEKFLINERQHCFQIESTNTSINHESLSSVVKQSLFKSTPCFIDASSLVDEEETVHVGSSANAQLEIILSTPSQPVPCSTIKQDISPVDWSESNENDDSLEQAGKKDPDSIQKDLSPTIFEMTPLTEDSLCINLFENATQSDVVNLDESINSTLGKERTHPVKSILMASTPNNSIMSLKTYKSEDSDNITVVGSESFTKNLRKGSNSPPILSGGVSVEDHLPQVGSSHESSPLPKFKLENTPIVTGAYLPKPTEDCQEKPRHNSSAAWVVDMSSDPKSDDSFTINSKSSDDTQMGTAEKKNIFSMYIDLGDKTTLKEMPARLSSSINTKKHTLSVENRSNSQNTKVTNDVKLIEHDASVTIFEKYESLCNDPSISISEIIAIPKKHGPFPEIPEKSVTEEPSVNPKRTGQNEDKRPRHTEFTQDIQAKDLFVKLSDLDKPVQKADVLLSIDEKEVDVRMTRSIPDWGDEAFSNNSRSIEVITSFHSENALSLNRLFPHLKNEFSRSMPGSLSSRTRSPLRLGTSSILGDPDEQVSEISEISSMQSSNCRSGFGNSTTDSQTSSLIENCTSRLGQDLLRMFLEEIAPDVIVEVSGKRFKAHKCILSSRCQYFAGILSGGWVESLGNVIVLPPFSYNVVYFALCHIYSGLATIPDSVSIVELATIADMLGLEGLKEAIMFTLKAKYCHHFHKPCTVCVVGVLECFPLCSVYGLDDLYHKCLKWITKHFSKVWPTKAFATLPTDLLDKCYQHHVVNLTIDNVVDTVYGCGITAASLQNSRWSESVARMCRRLISAAANFAAPKLVAVFKAIPPLPNEAPHAAKQALDDCLAAAIEWAPPDEVCRAYAFLCALVKEIRNHHYSKPDLISNGTDSHKSFGPSNLLYTQAGSWRLQCEGALVRASPRVVTTQAFKDLPSELRKRLRELGCIKYGAHALPLTPPTPHQDRKSKNSNQIKHIKVSNTSTARNADIAHVRASFVPYSSKPTIPLTSTETLKSNNDLRDNRKPLVVTHPPKVRTTKAQEERAKFNKTKTTKSQDKLNSKMSGTRPPSFDKTKPRYLEPKIKDTKKLVVNKHLPKIDSSSESSRNSSPVHLRNLRASPQKGRRGEVEMQTMSQDSLATSSRPRTPEPSTDSLSESQTSNKYATYTKTKHTKQSVESNKIPGHQDPAQPGISANNKTKTKIPVYSNQNLKSESIEYRNSRDQKRGRAVVPNTNVNYFRGNELRKVSGSLMNATKSSSAKIVPKVVKEMPNNKMNTAKNQKSGHFSRHHCHPEEKENPSPLREIPVMERSGTFLKDEPTFGNKTTNIDIDQ